MWNYLIKSCLKYSKASDLYLVDNVLYPNLEKCVTMTLGIVLYDYQGKSFEGRQWSKMLANCDYLTDLTLPECFPLIDCLRFFRKIIAATFSEDLLPNYEEVFKQFGSTFSKVMSIFRIRLTPKLHILLQHLPQWCLWSYWHPCSPPFPSLKPFRV